MILSYESYDMTYIQEWILVFFGSFPFDFEWAIATIGDISSLSDILLL